MLFYFAGNLFDSVVIYQNTQLPRFCWLQVSKFKQIGMMKVRSRCWGGATVEIWRQSL